MTPPGFSTFRWIQFSEYGDWQAVATWAASLFDEGEAPRRRARAAIVATLMAKPTVEERVVGALEFVQSQVRYFSVSLGTSSHRPTAPNTVLARRYGDCKDKSLLLVTLLKDMGIAEHAGARAARQPTGFDDWLPTPLAFDHVIVAVDVDGQRYWLDSTRQGQHGALATMGQAHDGAQVLPASSTAGRLQRIDVPNRDALVLNERRRDADRAGTGRRRDAAGRADAARRRRRSDARGARHDDQGTRDRVARRPTCRSAIRRRSWSARARSTTIAAPIG